MPLDEFFTSKEKERIKDSPEDRKRWDDFMALEHNERKAIIDAIRAKTEPMDRFEAKMLRRWGIMGVQRSKHRNRRLSAKLNYRRQNSGVVIFGGHNTAS